MSLTAAVGILSEVIDVLRNTIAESATFRAWVNAPNTAEALEHIYYEGYPPPGDGVAHTLEELLHIRPCAIVWMEPLEGLRGEKAAAGAGKENFNHSGTVMVKLIQDIDPDIAADPGEISRRFCNVVGGVVNDVLALNESGGYLATRGWSCFGPFLEEAERIPEVGNTIELDLRFEWGMG